MANAETFPIRLQIMTLVAQHITAKGSSLQGGGGPHTKPAAHGTEDPGEPPPGRDTGAAPSLGPFRGSSWTFCGILSGCTRSPSHQPHLWLLVAPRDTLGQWFGVRIPTQGLCTWAPGPLDSARTPEAFPAE